jgi:predicted transcriptional regulator
MFARMLEGLFGCWHNHLSFPMSAKPGVRRNAAASVTGTYVVCLDCGKEFAYDWREMKIVSAAASNQRRVRDLATKEAA